MEKQPQHFSRIPQECRRIHFNEFLQIKLMCKRNERSERTRLENKTLTLSSRSTSIKIQIDIPC